MSVPLFFEIGLKLMKLARLTKADEGQLIKRQDKPSRMRLTWRGLSDKGATDFLG